MHLAVLKTVGLAVEHQGLLRRTREGDRVARAWGRDDHKPLALALLRAGTFHDQARHLIQRSKIEPESGDLLCELRAARAGASQLVGLLQWWGEVLTTPVLRIPKSIVEELGTLWALLPPDPTTPDWELERKKVGNRAELYSFQVERAVSADPSNVSWVARDSDALGWDIEDRCATPVRRIEVKGSRDSTVFFFLSDNEWKKATEYGDAYEVHFWGEINLSLDPAVEFACLKQSGYPIVIKNIIAQGVVLILRALHAGALASLAARTG